MLITTCPIASVPVCARRIPPTVPPHVALTPARRDSPKPTLQDYIHTYITNGAAPRALPVSTLGAGHFDCAHFCEIKSCFFQPQFFEISRPRQARRFRFAECHWGTMTRPNGNSAFIQTETQTCFQACVPARRSLSHFLSP